MKVQNKIKTSLPIDIAKKVVLNVLFTQNIVSDRLSEILKPFDLSNEQFNVLRILRGQKGNPANMSLILERMVAKTSNTTRLVDKLLLKKFVTRDVCSSNRRKIEVQITADGLEILEVLDPLIVEHEQQFARNLTTDELLTFNILLEKYRNIE